MRPDTKPVLILDDDDLARIRLAIRILEDYVRKPDPHVAPLHALWALEPFREVPQFK